MEREVGDGLLREARQPVAASACGEQTADPEPGGQIEEVVPSLQQLGALLAAVEQQVGEVLVEGGPAELRVPLLVGGATGGEGVPSAV